MTAIQRVVSRAVSEIGYLEKATNEDLDSKTANAGYNNYTKYARDVARTDLFNGNKNGYAWCATFYVAMFFYTFGAGFTHELLYLPPNSLGASCYYAARYYRQNGAMYNTPQPGDQIFFVDSDGDEYHTGMVEKVENGRVYTIEGNTSSSAGVVPNGGGVFRKSYDLHARFIGGYGRPNWSVLVNDDDDGDDSDDGDDDVVRYKYLKDIPTASNFRNIINMLMDAKILNGDGSDPVGNNDIIDLSHDMVRVFVINYRAGCYDDAIIASGRDPDEYR